MRLTTPSRRDNIIQRTVPGSARQESPSSTHLARPLNTSRILQDMQLARTPTQPTPPTARPPELAIAR